MYKNLRIVFTILSAICLAAAIPLGIAFDFLGVLSAAVGAGIFFLLMLLCKQSQESAEKKQQKFLEESVQNETEADNLTKEQTDLDKAEPKN